MHLRQKIDALPLPTLGYVVVTHQTCAVCDLTCGCVAGCAEVLNAEEDSLYPALQRIRFSHNKTS